jgi:hypothetical protein
MAEYIQKYVAAETESRKASFEKRPITRRMKPQKDTGHHSMVKTHSGIGSSSSL